MSPEFTARALARMVADPEATARFLAAILARPPREVRRILVALSDVQRAIVEHEIERDGGEL